MSKLCLSCFSKIPVFASKCPNCIEKGQSVTGRIFLVLLAMGGLYMAAKSCSSPSKSSVDVTVLSQPINTNDSPVLTEKKEAYKDINKLAKLLGEVGMPLTEEELAKSQRVVQGRIDCNQNCVKKQESCNSMCFHTECNIECYIKRTQCKKDCQRD